MVTLLYIALGVVALSALAVVSACVAAGVSLWRDVRRKPPRHGLSPWDEWETR